MGIIPFSAQIRVRIMLKYDKFNPNPYGSHMKLLDLVDKNKVVLDVGCATGQLAKRLKEKGCKVYGIEIDEDAAKIARKYCEDVIVGDIEFLENLPYSEKFFDYIIFSDVLEHLKDPLTVLKRSRKYLKDNGYILCSIPNVAYIYVRLNLLFGKWDYQKKGILDEQHLRFFTLKTFNNLVEKAGFKVEKIDVTIPGKVAKIRGMNRFAYFLAKIKKNLFGYQFIIIAKK